MKALVIAETPSTQELLCAGARILADEVHLATIKGCPVTSIADYAYNIALPDDQPSENAFDTVLSLYGEIQPEVVLLESNPRLKIIGGRLAAQADTSVVSDVIAFEGEQAQSLYFGGLAVRTQTVNGPVRFFSTSGAPFTGLEASGTDQISEVAFVQPEQPITLLSSKQIPHEGADLNKARVVVGAGRGFAKEEDLGLARQLCLSVKGELACSRPLAENVKWMPRSLYLGVSGRQISPHVYLAVGISGQMQHMIGVANADIIVAINKDQNASIFRQADYAIVGDLYKVIPVLVEKLA